MAKANRKTKPVQRQRVFGENDADDSFIPPDRQDVQSQVESTDMPTEVIDFRAGTTEILDEPEGDGDPDRDADDTRDPPQRQTRQTDRSTDDDDRGMTRKMRQRVQRERAIVNRERALREQAEAKLAQERTARQAVEDRVTRIERTQAQVDANTDVKALRAQIEALKPQIVAQTEAGNTKDALSLQIQLGETQSKLAVLEQDLKYRSMDAERRTREEEQRRQQQQQRGGDDTSRQVHPADKQEAIDRSNEFKRMNRHWWRKRENEEVRALSIDVDREILQDISDGVCEFEPYSDEHFEEMASRLHDEYPDIEFVDFDGKTYEFSDQGGDSGGNARREARVQNNGRRGNGNNGRPPQGGNGSRVRGNRAPDAVEMARRGQVALTQEDFNTMRTFKLDPANPEHKKAFAQQRARTILQEASRGGNR